MSEAQRKSPGRAEVCRVLVTGAGGALGPVMVRHLVDAGYAVRTVTRSSPAPCTFVPCVENWTGDISNRDFIRRAVEGVKMVFHLAARLHVTNPGAELRLDYWRVNVEGTRNVVDACIAEDVRRLIYFSTINVYGATPGKYVDEDTAPHPEGIYAETKLAAEELVLAAKGSPSGETLGVVLRMAAIYGPRMKGNYPRLVKALSRGVFLPVGDGSNRRTLIYEQDAVRAVLLAAQHPLAAGRIYNVSDGEIHLLRDIIAAICAALGRRPPRFFLPVGPTRWVARASDGLAGLAGSSLNLTAKVDKYVEDVAIRADRIKNELGYIPLCGLEEGWRRTISDWQAGLGSSDIAAR